MARWFGLSGKDQNKIMQDAFQEGINSGVPLDSYSRMERFVADWLYNRNYFGNAVNGKKAKSAIQSGDYNKFWTIGSNEKQLKELHKWIDNARSMATTIANEKGAGGLTGTTMQEITGSGDAAKAGTATSDKTIMYLIVGVVGVVALVLLFKMFAKKQK